MSVSRDIIFNRITLATDLCLSWPKVLLNLVTVQAFLKTPVQEIFDSDG